MNFVIQQKPLGQASGITNPEKNKPKIKGQIHMDEFITKLKKQRHKIGKQGQGHKIPSKNSIEQEKKL